jgi:hypothetical protein
LWCVGAALYDNRNPDEVREGRQEIVERFGWDGITPLAWMGK